MGSISFHLRISVKGFERSCGVTFQFLKLPPHPPFDNLAIMTSAEGNANAATRANGSAAATRQQMEVCVDVRGTRVGP